MRKTRAYKIIETILAIVIASVVMIFIINKQVEAREPLCIGTEEAHDVLTEEYGERPVASKVEEGLYYEFWMNEDTGTYSILGYPNADTACLLESGIIPTGTAI